MDITAVITAHDEGLLARASLLSLRESVRQARAIGLSVEIVVILDRADSLTRAVFCDFSRNRETLQIYSVDFGDPGLARNFAAENARGEWIAFLDADDIWSCNWLAAAQTAARSDFREIVWHPEVNVYFGSRSHLFCHIDMDDPDFRISQLAYANAWTALCFARTGLVRELPYPRSDLSSGIGYEDWYWNMEVVSAGAIHKIVPDTSHAIRRRGMSVVTRTNALHCLPPPTRLFRQILETRQTRAAVTPKVQHGAADLAAAEDSSL